MSNADPTDLPEPKHDPLAALRQPSFVLYSVSRIFSTLGQSLLQAVMAWQVWDLTGSALSLGILGMARFLPALAVSMVGGTVADAYDRRKIIMLAQTVPLTCSTLLAVGTAGGWIRVEYIYFVVVLLGLASAFEAPARTAFLPAIVRPDTFANAVTVNNIFQKLGSMTGPAIGGAMIPLAGISSGYSAYSMLIVLAAVPLLLLNYERRASGRQGVSVSAIKEGVAYVRGRQVLLGSMSLDMFAVIFGGVTALLPLYADEILHAGSTGYGILQSAMQAGAFLMSFVLVIRPPVKRTGRALVWTVVAYGLLTVAFGVSRELWLSVVLYGLIGAADQVSVVMRQTTIQMTTPDELRGRVSSVHQVFVQASSQIGAIESGFVAALTTATFSVVSGGLGAIAIALLIGWRMPELYRYQVRARARIEPQPAARPATAERAEAMRASAEAGGSG